MCFHFSAEGKPVPAFCPETLTASANRTILSRDCPFR